MKLATLALVSALVAVPAVAQPIYIDIGTNFGGNANKVAGATTTGWLNELQLNYESISTVFDTSGDGQLGAGDVITSKGGLFRPGFNVNEIGNNVVTSFLPKVFGSVGPSDNGYGNWALSFGFDNLVGTLDGFGGVNWQSGSIAFFATTNLSSCVDDGNINCFTRLFDMTVQAGNNIPGSVLLSGYLTNFNLVDNFNGVLAGDVFNTTFGGSKKSFSSIHNELASQGLQQTFSFAVDQNNNKFPSPVGFNNGTWTFEKVLHDGSLSFAVSEPTSLAVLGLGLIGLVARRRKAA